MGMAQAFRIAPTSASSGDSSMFASPNRLFGFIVGVLYLVIGAAGFFYTGNTAFAAVTGPRLIAIFEINPAHNIVHLVVGAILIIGAIIGIRTSKAINGSLGTIFLLAAVFWLLLPTHDNPLAILAVNSADMVLYFATAAVLITVTAGADRKVFVKAA
jgi:Domain of unknown function (DUF4383)